MEGMPYKQDIAMMYLPESTSPKAARDTVMGWIHGSPQLMEELLKTGYRRKAHRLTPRQVKLIFEYLGEP